MIDVVSYILIIITSFCFGLIVSFMLSHMHYFRKLIVLMRRSISTKTLDPVLSEYATEYEKENKKVRKLV
jgi:hypothetical protein